jgi:hypothetical protein
VQAVKFDDVKFDDVKFNPDDFPRLREFARGYLHQDVLREYGSAVAAAKAYLADLNEEERQEVRAEAQRLLVLAQKGSLKESKEALGKLGAAWRAMEKKGFSDVLLALHETDHPV